MLELNKWFFAQLANFLLLLVLLNIILFKPLLRLFRERDAGINGALNTAKSMGQEKDKVVAQIDAKLAEGRTKAKTLFENLSREGIDAQKQSLDSARNEASELNKKAKQEIEGAIEKARTSLRSDVENFSKQIVEKLVKA
jgi:F-type H+-transporting ATPase subunit b